jgi:hypothetical protein
VPGPVFELLAFRFRFRALGDVWFPPGLAGNVLRGALGTTFRRLACVPECTGAKTCERRSTCPYARLFEPVALETGPSGLGDLPRPFVIRARGLDGRRLRPGETFEFDLHVFDLEHPALAYFVASLSELARSGLGPGRPPASLEAVHEIDARCVTGRIVWDGDAIRDAQRVCVPLEPVREARRILVRFLSPTELKSEGRVVARPEFAVLFARARDRVSALRQFYGPGPVMAEFREMGERARAVRLVDARLEREHAERRSSKTGQVHPLDGILGAVVYEGDLTEFLPWLEAARWTGVGRQTVWGKGHIEVAVLE